MLLGALLLPLVLAPVALLAAVARGVGVRPLRQAPVWREASHPLCEIFSDLLDADVEPSMNASVRRRGRSLRVLSKARHVLIPISLLSLLGASYYVQLRLTGNPYGPFPFPDYIRLVAIGMIAALVAASDVWINTAPQGRRIESSVVRSSLLNYLFVAVAVCCSVFAAWLVHTTGPPALATTAWVAGTLSVVAAASGSDLRLLPRRLLNFVQRLPRLLEANRWLALMLLVVVGLVLETRFASLATSLIPVSGDEAENGLMARIVANGQMSSLFSYGWANLPMLGYAWEGSFVKVFGDSLFSLRLSSAVLGTISILLTGLLGRELFNTRVGVASSALLSVSHVHFHFSRLGHHFMQAVALTTGTLYFVALAFRQRSRAKAVIAGVLLGIDMQVYFSARVCFAIVPMFLLYMLINEEKQAFWAQIRIILWIFLGFLVGSLPILTLAVDNWDTFLERSRTVSIFNGGSATALSQYGTHDMRIVLREQFWRIVQTFNFLGDADIHYSLWHPILDPISSALFLPSFFYSCIRIRKPGHALLIFTIVDTALIGGVLTYSPPSWERLLPMIPAVCILIAAFLDQIYSMIIRWRVLTYPAAICSLLLLISIGYGNYSWYFQEYIPYTTVRAEWSLDSDIGSWLRGVGAGGSAYWLTTPTGTWPDRDTMHFLAPQISFCPLVASAKLDFTQCPSTPSPPYAFILMPWVNSYEASLKRLYPGGTLSTIKSYYMFGTVKVYSVSH